MENSFSNREVIFYENEDNFLFVLRNAFNREKMLAFRNVIDEYKVKDDKNNKFILGVASNELRLKEYWFNLWDDFNFEKNFELIDNYNQLTYPPQIRIVSHEEEFVPWHQDNAYIQALGNRGHKKIITCFVPLEIDLINRPSLQFGTKRFHESLHHNYNEKAATNKLSLSKEFIPNEDDRAVFELNLGDALLFGRYVTHRTYASITPFNPRCSMEFRITSEDCRIQGKDYYSLNTHTFAQYQGK